MTAINIQKGVEIPQTGWRGAELPNYPRTTDLPWDEMEVGDSFFVANPEGCDLVRFMNRITGSAQTAFGPGCVTTRCARENGSIGVRAWRIA